MSDQRQFNTVGYTGGSDEHDTPIDFFAPITNAVGGFDLDPCASSTSDLADTNYTIEDDGLSHEWFGKVFMNPPYSDVSDWMKYAVRQYEFNDLELLVALVFARTSTQWFHNHATTAETFCFVEGRLRFGEAENSAPAPSMVAVWGIDDHPELLRVLEESGFVLHND